jgi:hypothetical protein
MKVLLKGDFLLEVSSIKEKLAEKKINECVTALRDATPVDTGKARDGWKVVGKSIQNDVEYIDRLNEGSSPQAPTHFIEKTLLAQRNIVPRGTIVRSK